MAKENLPKIQQGFSDFPMLLHVRMCHTTNTVFTILRIKMNYYKISKKNFNQSPSGNASAAANELAPVKTPMSKTFFALDILMRAAFKLTTSGAPIIMDHAWVIVSLNIHK